MRKSLTVLICALLCACGGRSKQDASVTPGAPLKAGKAVVVVGIGLPLRELGSGQQRAESNHLNLEFARLANGRAEDGISVAEPSKWEIEAGPPVAYRVLQVEPGTYALSRAIISTDLDATALSASQVSRNYANRSPFIIHELLGDTAYQFKVAAGEVAYVGDFTVDLGQKPPRITVGHTPDRAAQALRKFPQFGTELADKAPTIPMPTGLAPRAMQTNDPIRSRLPPLAVKCPPMCQ